MVHNVTSLQIKRIKTHAQFEEVMKQTTRISYNNFVLHYRLNQLSTQVEPLTCLPVDNLKNVSLRFGLVIPKRWAKRAVTRSLIKRQCRAQFALIANQLPAGDWVVRLRRKFDNPPLVSASSPVLKKQVQQELQNLFKQVKKRFLQQPVSHLPGHQSP